MRIIFAGTPDFSVPTLEALVAKHEIVAVLTQPDKPVGRGQQIAQSPVKQCAMAHHLPILQPGSLKEHSVQELLKSLNADIMIVVAYGLILPETVLCIPKYGCLNLHASLLPKYRGASPIQQAILHGEVETGISIMKMDKGMDTGPVYDMVCCSIDDMTTSKVLHTTLSTLATSKLLTCLGRLARGDMIAWQKQDDSKATYAPKIKKSDARLDWKRPACQLLRQINAYNPWPVAYFELKGERIRCWSACVSSDKPDVALQAPGTVIQLDKTGVYVQTGDGILTLKVLQRPGKSQQAVAQLLNANNPIFSRGDILD